MVGDHPLHELHVGVRKLDASEIGGFLSGDLSTRFAWSARLNDRRLCGALYRAEREGYHDDHEGRGESLEV